MHLICKNCGYKQRDDETLHAMRKTFPDLSGHDLPYYCGACLDNADGEKYDKMIAEMTAGPKKQ